MRQFNSGKENLIDKIYEIVADILLKILPASKNEKEAFSFYREGLSAQSAGEYAEALESYYQSLQIEEDPINRGYIFFNIGLIYSSNGKYSGALEYYRKALEENPNLASGYNNIAVIYHYQGTKFAEKRNSESAKKFFGKAAKYWKQAIKLAPDTYLEAENWLKTTGRNFL